MLLKRPLILAATVFALAACGTESSDDPVGTVRAFLAATGRGECGAAWSYFSGGTQENIAAQVRQTLRHTDYPRPDLTPQTLYCQSYGEAKSGSARLLQQEVTTAVVSVLFSEGTHLPLIPFLSTPYREWRDTLQLVREDGRWKIERPRVEVERPGTKRVEIGEVEVVHHLGGDPRREWIEAEGLVRAPRDAVEALLMNPAAWPRFMPLIKSVQPIAGPDGNGGWSWRLHFEAPAGTAAETVVQVRPYGHLRDAALPWTTVQWVVEDHDDRGSTPATPLFTGSWKLQPRRDGLWTRFGIVIQPDEWPAPLPAEFLKPETMAQALTALDREAAASASVR